MKLELIGFADGRNRNHVIEREKSKGMARFVTCASGNIKMP